MSVIGIFGARGGVGASLLAANLACALAQRGRSLLLDLHPLTGADDLYLGLGNEQTWVELLPLVAELSDNHLELMCQRHASGLRVLAAPSHPLTQLEPMLDLVNALEPFTDYLVVDLPRANPTIWKLPATPEATQFLVTCLDPPSLRSARHTLAIVPPTWKSRTRLVISQWATPHPLSPEEASQALGIDLAAVLPFDPEAIGQQVHFGLPAVLQEASTYGKAVRRFASQIAGGRHPSAEQAPLGHGIRGRDVGT